MKNRSLYLLLLILALKGCIAFLIIAYAGIGLGPDEAQYWTWSQQLDWGYYSKPPGIAWQIALGTWWFGNTEWGVRSIAVFLSLATAGATYLLAIYAGGSEKTALWSGCVMALSPLGWFASLFAMTDTGYILCWTSASCCMAQALKEQKEPPYLWIGFWVLCGALFKWPIYLFWLFVLLFVKGNCKTPAPKKIDDFGANSQSQHPGSGGFDENIPGRVDEETQREVAPKGRFYLVREFCNCLEKPSKKLLWGIGLSMFGLVPSIAWNMQHEWVTFRHVSATIFQGAVEQGTNLSLFRGNAGSFLGAQAALLSPLFFLLYLWSGGYLLLQWKTIPRPMRFCGAVSFLLLAAYFVLAFQKKMQGNWCIFAYPTGIVFLCWVYCERVVKDKLVLTSGLAVSVLTTAFVFGLPALQSHDFSPHIPFAKNPFKHNVGWQALGRVLDQHPSDFLLGDRYQMASELSFYGPEQKRAYFINLHALRKNQFSFWPSLEEEQKGKTGLFVVVENEPFISERLHDKRSEYVQRLEPYFTLVEEVGIFPLYHAYGQVTKSALVIRCENVRQSLPADPSKY